MARIRPFGAYPPGYAEAVRLVIQGSKKIEIPFEDSRRALSWRGQFYAFLGAVKIAAGKPEATEAMRELGTLALQVLVSVRQTGPEQWVVRLEHRDHSWQADALRNALVTSVAPPAGPPVPMDLLAMIVPQAPDGTLPPPTVRSEERAADKEGPSGQGPPSTNQGTITIPEHSAVVQRGKSKKDSYY
jgi:hypothetical protein